MKIIITGCAGFVASNVSKKLLEEGHEVYGVDNLLFGFEENVPEGLTWDNVDFDKIGERFLEKYDVLVHCATINIIYAMTYPIHTFETNALNSIKLFQRFKGKIIYTSTASVYGNATIIPTPESAENKVSNAYDQSKLIAEHFLAQRGNYTTLRLSNVYGVNQRAENPYCGVIGKMIDKALKGEAIEIIGDGTQTRDFTYIDDVVSAVLLSVNQEAKNTEINIASGIESTMNQLAYIIKGCENLPPNKYIHARKIDAINRRCLLVEKANYLLGWFPQTTLLKGIEKTVDWQRK